MYSICIAGEWAITNPDFDIGSRPYNFIKNAMHFDLLRPVGVEYSHSRGGPIALHFVIIQN